MTANTVKSPTRTKQYRALIAAGLDKDAALAAYNAVNAPAPVNEADAKVQSLVNAGFTEEQAAVALTKAEKPAKKSKKAKKAPKELTKAEQDAALVEAAGLTFTKGRVYTNPAIIEGQVRVLKTGRSEIVQASGNGRVHSVLIFLTDSGDAAVQHLVKQS